MFLRAWWFVLLMVGPGWSAAPTLQAWCWDQPPVAAKQLTRFVWFRQNSRPADVAKESLMRPAGRRVLFSWDLHRDLLAHPDDVCRTAAGQLTKFHSVWPERGVALAKERFTRFYREFQAAGGQMDALIFDFEAGYSNWALGGADQLDRYRAIQNDPRFPALAAKLGFSDLSWVANWGGRRNYLKWNAVLGAQVIAALREACWQPAADLYPGLIGSNYEDVQIREAEAVPDLNGHLQWSESGLFGTCNAPSLYTWIGQLGDRRLDGRQPFGRQPFAGLLLSLNVVRAIQRSSDRPLMPWVAWWRYAGDGPKMPPATVGNTPYWRELVIHLALAGTETYLFWNPHVWAANQPPESMTIAADETYFDTILTDLNQRLAGQRRAPLTTAAVPWDAPLLVTGLRVDDRAVWRVTVPSGVKEVQATVGGRRQVLPVAANDAGVWFVTAAGETPQFSR